MKTKMNHSDTHVHLADLQNDMSPIPRDSPDSGACSNFSTKGALLLKQRHCKIQYRKLGEVVVKLML